MVPKLDSSIEARTRQRGTSRCKGKGLDPVCVPRESLGTHVASGIPNSNGPIVSARCQPLSVGRERQRMDVMCMTGEYAGFGDSRSHLANRRINQSEISIGAARRNCDGEDFPIKINIAVIISEVPSKDSISRGVLRAATSNVFPSARQTSEPTDCRCVSKVFTTFRVAKSQIRTIGSLPAEAN